VTHRQRLLVLLVVVLVVATGSTAYALAELRRSQTVSSRTPSVPAATGSTLTGPRLVFRHTGLDSEYGVVAEVPLDDPSGARTFTGVSCDRVYAVAGGASCLKTKRGVVTTFQQVDLDADWKQVGEAGLPGIPSRTRLSADGKLSASTSFVSGHSYMTIGFSTATEIHEVGGKRYGNLEGFALYLDGKKVTPVDRNIWGVTFAADDNTFYATVSTGGRTYLARGDLAARTLTTIADKVECPSLSPDGTKLAFKERVDHGSGTWWTPAVMDLRTMKRTILSGETRNVDDQIAWLDDDTLLYGLARTDEAGVSDIWSLDVDPAAKPQLLVEQAWSPAVIR
jgi:dipeptidyl aminopeptidase/acylaminoacyl peptidase